MRRKVVVDPEANRDVAAAANWYRRDSDEVARRFRASVKAAIGEIKLAPEGYVLLPGAKGARFKNLHRFPYLIVYRVLADSIRILGVYHSARDRPWRDRV